MSNKKSHQERGKKSKGRQSASKGSSNLPKEVRSVPGFHAVGEVIKVRPHKIHSFWMRKDWVGVQELISIQEWASKNQLEIQLKSVQELDKISAGHQGVFCHVYESPELDWEDLKSENQSLVIALDGLEDPHNLGAILRTSWLMGAKGLLVPEARSVHLSPAAMKVACGAAEHVPLQVESNLPSVLKSLKDLGFWVYGLSHKASSSLWQVEFPEKVVWVIGSEAKGLRTPVERVCDELVSIPQLAAHASYNASVAAAIAMAETQRQWRE